MAEQAIIDENSQEPADDVQTYEVTIALPEPLKMVHWHCYVDALNKYRVEERKANRIPDELTAKLYGAMALIRAGYVTISGMDELAGLQVDEHLDIAVAGIALDYIAFPIEAEMNSPLAAFSKRRFGSTTTRIVTNAQKG